MPQPRNRRPKRRDRMGQTIPRLSQTKNDLAQTRNRFARTRKAFPRRLEAPRPCGTHSRPAAYHRFTAVTPPRRTPPPRQTACPFLYTEATAFMGRTGSGMRSYSSSCRSFPDYLSSLSPEASIGPGFFFPMAADSEESPTPVHCSSRSPRWCYTFSLSALSLGERRKAGSRRGGRSNSLQRMLGDVSMDKAMHKNVFEAIHLVDVRADAHETESCGERL
jgi:hypothetical protein